MNNECQGRMRLLGNCARKPVVCRDGKHYCWQHDPERLAKIAEENWAKRKEEISSEDAKWDAERRRKTLEKKAEVDSLTNAELEEIIALGGIKSMVKKLKES